MTSGLPTPLPAEVELPIRLDDQLLDTPAVLVDLDVLENNITRMQSIAARESLQVPGGCACGGQRPRGHDGGSPRGTERRARKWPLPGRPSSRPLSTMTSPRAIVVTGQPAAR